ncbi:uncharacterized protein LOC144130330 [Amblyomma americanum]
MKVFFALAALLCLASADQGFSICNVSSDVRHNLVTCVRANVNEETSQKLGEVKQRLECEDLDCVFEKICELGRDTHQQHSNSFFSEEVKAGVRAALVTCQQNH